MSKENKVKEKMETLQRKVILRFEYAEILSPKFSRTHTILKLYVYISTIKLL